uniref:Uncharacterized protein n=2 Tax=Caenorhabditis japonica TaxID=281687 RepID=A0A8R1DEK0_CAEJA
MEQLEAILLLAKKKLDESLNLDANLKKEIDLADGANRLKSFTSAQTRTPQKINNFVNSGTKMAKKIETLSPIEKQSIGSGWNNFSAIGPLMETFSSEIKKLPFNISNKHVDFKSFGNSLSILDKLNVPSLDFAMMLSTLDNLKSTGIGQSQEVVETENCLIQLEDLQYAALRRNGYLWITDAQIFFQKLFEKPSDSDRLWLWILLVCVTVIILCFICVVVCNIKMCPPDPDTSSSERESDVNEGKDELLSPGEAQTAETSVINKEIEDPMNNESSQKKSDENKASDKK